MAIGCLLTKRIASIYEDGVSFTPAISFDTTMKLAQVVQELKMLKVWLNETTK